MRKHLVTGLWTNNKTVDRLDRWMNGQRSQKVKYKLKRKRYGWNRKDESQLDETRVHNNTLTRYHTTEASNYKTLNKTKNYNFTH